MATNIPPHNLREVIDAVIGVIEVTLEAESGETAGQISKADQRADKQRRILSAIKGPDFPAAASSSAAPVRTRRHDRARIDHDAREGRTSSRSARPIARRSSSPSSRIR